MQTSSLSVAWNAGAAVSLPAPCSDQHIYIRLGGPVVILSPHWHAPYLACCLAALLALLAALLANSAGQGLQSPAAPSSVSRTWLQLSELPKVPWWGLRGCKWCRGTSQSAALSFVTWVAWEEWQGWHQTAVQGLAACFSGNWVFALSRVILALFPSQMRKEINI